MCSKVFKNGPNKMFERHPLKKLKWYDVFMVPYLFYCQLYACGDVWSESTILYGVKRIEKEQSSKVLCRKFHVLLNISWKSKVSQVLILEYVPINIADK